jgi:hypothetical protein
MPYRIECLDSFGATLGVSDFPHIIAMLSGLNDGYADRDEPDIGEDQHDKSAGFQLPMSGWAGCLLERFQFEYCLACR